MNYNRALWKDSDEDVWASNKTGPSCATLDGNKWCWKTDFSSEKGWPSLDVAAKRFKLEVLIPKEYME